MKEEKLFKVILYLLLAVQLLRFVSKDVDAVVLTCFRLESHCVGQFLLPFPFYVLYPVGGQLIPPQTNNVLQPTSCS